MGGTDKFDQYGSYYRTKVRAQRWSVRIYTHMFTACAINAYIVAKDDKRVFATDLLTFMKAVIVDLKPYAWRCSARRGGRSCIR